MFHDELDDYDDGHMLQLHNVNDHTEKQAEHLEQHEVSKFVNLHIKIKKTWQMHDA